MKRLLKPWIVMPLVAVVAVGVWWFVSHRGSDTAEAATRTVTATQGDMARTISAAGTVEAAETDDLSFTSGGTVTAVKVKAGDTVTKGQVLATIDSSDLEAAVASAESNLASKQAQLSDDTSAGASSEQLDSDETAVTTAQDQLDQANENLAGAELVATFDGTVASVDLTVGEQLGSSGSGGTTTTGTGSGSGMTSNNLASAGSGGMSSSQAGGTSSGGTGAQSSNSPQIEVISSGRYTVTLDVSSSDVANVKVGQSATVALSSSSSGSGNARFAGRFGNFGGFGGGGQQTSGAAGESRTATTLPPDIAGTRATGKVTSVGTVADASSGVATYPVVVTFTGSSDTYQPGAGVNATITYSQISDAVQVPTRAVTTTDDGSTVTVVDGPTEKKVDVTVGESLDGMTQITSGLDAGQKVVISTITFDGFRSGSSGGNGNGATPGDPDGGGGTSPGFDGAQGGGGR